MWCPVSVRSVSVPRQIFFHEIYIIIPLSLSRDSMRHTWWVLPGYCIGLGGLALITFRTLRAVFSESKSITLQVNTFGEQYVDVLCLVLLWVVCLIGMRSLWSVMNERSSTKSARSDPLATKTARTPFWFFNGASFSFSDEPGGVAVVPFDESRVQDDFPVFTGVEPRTNRDFSFSVHVVSTPFEK
jgi:hypothetical protein